MCATVFMAGGADPTVLSGAELDAMGGAYRIGESENFIFEACEYMDSFLDFNPSTAIILNIEMDHVDYFKSMEQIYKSYSDFAAITGENGTVHIIRTAAVVSGGAGMDGLLCAVKCGADLLITGEFDHTMYHVVQENNIHVIALGHYNSETHGVRNLQKLAETKLNMQTVFLDIPTGL